MPIGVDLAEVSTISALQPVIEAIVSVRTGRLQGGRASPSIKPSPVRAALGGVDRIARSGFTRRAFHLYTKMRIGSS
jgi:hypothetical protein